MVACELDSEVSGDLLGWRLPAWQALLLHRALPSCGGLLVYLTLICFDIALIYEHYINDHTGIGAFCIILMVLPAVICLVFTLASPPPRLQTDLSAFTVTIQKKEVKWILMQFLNCLFFPIAAIGRYCHQIFWWVEAVYATRAQDENRTAEALNRARAPSSLELYLFLQAFLHSAPHVILNTLDLLYRFNNPAYDKVSVQAVSIVTSMMRMASTATLYRRFEREKLNGRQYPWRTKVTLDDNKSDIKTENKEEPIYEAIMKKQSISSNKLDDRPNAHRDLIEFSPSTDKKSPWEDESYSDSGNSSEEIPQESFGRKSYRSSISSEEEYVRPISIIEKVAPRRRDTQYTIEHVHITPPPAIPAPRPMSLAVWAEKLVENAESIPFWLSAPPRRRHVEEFIIPDEPELPRRVPRSYIRGLEPQDATAALIQYLGWYAFFVSRLISIAAFIDCMPVVAIVVLMSHYQVMLLLLIVPQASTVRRSFYIFLAFIYLFCLMEYKIRFRHVRVWHVFWILVCTVETIVFIALWSSLDNNYGDWWKMYVIKVTLFSLLLSYMCFLVYFVLLKPRETVVYINKSNVSTK